MAGSRETRRCVIAFGALLLAGCLESTPPPVKGHEGDAGLPPVQPLLDAGAVERDPDAPPRPFGDGGPDDWAGTWLYTSGALGLECNGTISVQASEGALLIAPAPTGDSLTVIVDGCSFHFALAGLTATTAPTTQACPKWAIPTIPVWTLTLSPNGTIEEKIGGRVNVNGDVCMISGTSKLTRQ